jgi:hypothetical protein
VQKFAHIAGFLVVVLLAVASFGQSASDDSLCMLQQKVTDGEHLHVRVAGVLGVGLDQGILTDAACPETTWVELALENKKNRKKLVSILDHSQHYEAYVVFEGELYGPSLPDPKLPEAIRKSYRPWWGHLNCCRTKLVVRGILAVSPVPTAAQSDSQGKAN